MARLTEAAEHILMDRFGKDNVIALAKLDLIMKMLQTKQT